VIVRLTKVLSRTDKLLTGWIENLAQGKPVTPFADMTMAPVSLENVVDVLVWAITATPGGVVQVSGPRDITYVQAARRLATRMQADMGLVKNGLAASAGLSADETPPFTSLDTTRLYAESSIRIADAYDLIDDILAAHTQHA
jgi:dTDP-4-dehydrorhamnose reductase